jgi:lipid A disaccharide synthetase
MTLTLSPNDPIDLLILTNGPGELTTWVRPTLAAIANAFGVNLAQVRISIVLSPCPNASGSEMPIAQSYPGVDRVQGAADFWPFLLLGKTKENWDWRARGVVLFLGGDQIFPVLIGKRFGYKTVVYSEWDAIWPGLIDRYAVMKSTIVEKAPLKFQKKFTIVGDLMLEAGREAEASFQSTSETIGLLPGSKRAKLMQGVPLMLAIAQAIHAVRPTTQFVIPVAPTLSLVELASYAQASQNPAFALVEGVSGKLVEATIPYLETPQGVRVMLHQTADRTPPYNLLKQCQICLTTAGANTAELGALGVPMLVLLPTNQLDAMRAWNGIPGILANLPGVGTLFAKLINSWIIRRVGFLAWPNIWAGEEIVPEIMGHLHPQDLADLTIDYLENPEKLATMRLALQSVRGETGAADKLAAIVLDLVNFDNRH